MSEIISINSRKPPTFYTLRIAHHQDGKLQLFVEDVADDERSRESIAWAMRELADSLDDRRADDLPNLEHIDLTYAIAGKLAEFYPQETPRDMEKNHRLARAIQRLPMLREVVGSAIASDRRARQTNSSSNSSSNCAAIQAAAPADALDVHEIIAERASTCADMRNWTRFDSSMTRKQIIEKLGKNAAPADAPKPCGWLTGSGTMMAEDMYYRFKDAQEECDRHNDFERLRPDFDPENLRAPRPVYDMAPAEDAREQKIAAQRSRMRERFANRPRTPATADFDLPAPNDNIDSVAAGHTQPDRPIHSRCAGICQRYDELEAMLRRPSEDAREGGPKHGSNRAETRMNAGFEGGTEDARERQPVPPDDLPRWIDDLKGKDPTIDGLIEYIIRCRATGTDRAQAGEDA